VTSWKLPKHSSLSSGARPWVFEVMWGLGGSLNSLPIICRSVALAPENTRLIYMTFVTSNQLILMQFDAP